jgi:hypothetical protein
MAQHPTPYLVTASSFTRLLDHTQRSTTVGRTLLDEWSAHSQRPLPDNTQHSRQADIRAPGGIRTHNLSRQAAPDLRLRPRGQWDRIKQEITDNKVMSKTDVNKQNYISGREMCVRVVTEYFNRNCIEYWSRKHPCQILPLGVNWCTKCVVWSSVLNYKAYSVSNLCKSVAELRGPREFSWYSDSLRAGRSGDRIPLGGEIFRTSPDRPWGPPSLLHSRYRVSFPGVKRPGCGVDHTPHLAPSLIPL